MLALESAIDRLYKTREADFTFNAYDDGKDEQPDIISYGISASIETNRWNPDCPDIVFYLETGDFNEIWDALEVYRMPLLDKDKLTLLLPDIIKQAHT